MAAAAPTGSGQTLPAGAALVATLQTDVSSDDADVDDSVEAVLSRPVVIDGRELAPAGSTLKGTVTESGRREGRPVLAIRFDTLVRGDDEIPVRAAVLRWTGSIEQLPAGSTGNGSIFKKLKKGLHLGKDGSTIVHEAHVARGTPVTVTLNAPLVLSAR